MSTVKAIKFTIAQIQEAIEANKTKIEHRNFTEPTPSEIAILYGCAEEFGFEVDTSLENNLKTREQDYRGAVLMISGDYTITPSYEVTTGKGKEMIEMCILQETVMKKRMKEFAHYLIHKKLVTLAPGCDEEYLYESLVTAAENQFQELINTRAKGLPVYAVIFDEEGWSKIEVMGAI